MKLPLTVFALIILASPAYADTAASQNRAVGLLGPGLRVENLERELSFYVDGLGMTKLMQMGSPQYRETMLGFDGGLGQPGLILITDTTKSPPQPLQLGTAFDKLVFRVVGLDGVVAKLRKLGFVVSDIHNAAKGYQNAIATDAQGYKVELVESARKGN